MRRFFPLLAMLLLILPASSWSQGTLTVLGAGASSCTRYLADTQASPAYQGVYSNWALGYLTALNVINSGKPGAKILSDAAGLDLKLKAFCAANQAKSYSDAVTALAVEYFK